MNRRQFLGKTLTHLGLGLTTIGLVRCAEKGQLISAQPSRSLSRELFIYDTYAMALYYDGTMGPKTGIIRAESVVENREIEMEFWHGHGGRRHRYVVTPSHFDELKQMKKVTIETDSVQGHTHTLFIDLSDPRWRVPGAKPVPIENPNFAKKVS